MVPRFMPAPVRMPGWPRTTTVPAGGAVNREASPRHAGADPLDPATVAFQDDFPIGTVPGDGEEFAEGRLGVAVLDRQRRDLRGGFAGEVVRRQALGFHGNRGGALVLKDKHGAGRDAFSREPQATARRGRLRLPAKQYSVIGAS